MVASHGFIDLDGNGTQGFQTTFPILKQDLSNRFQLIGTGFFISSCGLFVSARHVLRDCFEEKTGAQKHPIFLVQFTSKGHYSLRHILWCSTHNIADVAIGCVEPSEYIQTTPCLTLSTSAPSIKDKIATYAYPKTTIERIGDQHVWNFVPSFYDGYITESFPGGRDRVLLPGPCYQTSMTIHGGASGGPVAGHSGRVLAINSTGYDGSEDLSFVSRIDEIFALSIPRIKLPDGQEVHDVRVTDLARAGWLDVEGTLR